jgi:hypothetical protein
MFTQQAPFLLATLQNSVDSSTAMQMAQAFGNCNQPLSHRAGVTLHRSALPQSGGVLNGPGGSGYSYADGAFGFTAGNDPATQFSPWAFDRGNYYGGDSFANSTQFAFRSGDQFLAAYPDAAANAFYNLSQSFQFGPISTVNNSPWYTRMGDVNNFDFTTRLGDNINNFAGPTFQVAGDSYYDNSVHNSQTVNNQNVSNQFVEQTEINNLNVTYITQNKGDPGEAGPAGPQGRAGDPGIPGGIGRAGRDGRNGIGGGYQLKQPALKPADMPLPTLRVNKLQVKINMPVYALGDDCKIVKVGATPETFDVDYDIALEPSPKKLFISPPPELVPKAVYP